MSITTQHSEDITCRTTEEANLDYALRNTLILGGSGFDRLNLIRHYLDRVLRLNGGALIVSSYAEMSTFHAIRQLCAKYGRETDLRLVNQKRRDRGKDGWAPKDGSYRFNPFEALSPPQVSDLVVSLMDPVGTDGSMWKGRAIAMMNCIINALVWLRDHQGMRLGPQEVSDHLSIEKMIGLHNDERLPEGLKRDILYYLNSLPGFNLEKGFNQSSTTRDQHGYLTMQFTKLLRFLAYEVGNQEANYQEIDLREEFEQKRIVVCLVPQEDFGNHENNIMGQMVARGMCFAMQTSEAVQRQAPSKVAPGGLRPFVCMFDKLYGALAEIEMLTNYGRGRGIGVVYGDDSLAHLRRVNERTAESLIANTATKAFLRSDDFSMRQLVDNPDVISTMGCDAAYVLRDGIGQLRSNIHALSDL